MDVSGNGKAPAEEQEKLNNESAGESKAPAEEQEKLNDNTESGAQSSYVAMTVTNSSEYQAFGYADYTQMFWGGCTNGLVVGVLLGILAAVIKSLYNITQNNKGD